MPADNSPTPVPLQQTILVIDDDVCLRRALARALAQAGYEILSASSATEALTLCDPHEGEIALVVTDVLLPDMDGRDLVARLQADRPWLRAVFISGFDARTLRDSGSFPTETALLTKPFTTQELLDEVRAALGGPEVASQGA